MHIRLKRTQVDRLEAFLRAFNEGYQAVEKASAMASEVVDLGLDWLYAQHKHLFPGYEPEFEIVRKD